MKKILASLLALVMLLSVMPAFSLSVNAETAEFAGGSGTPEDPYLIATKEHLDNVRNNPDAHYKMIADVVFATADFEEGGDFYNASAGWVPIATFNGVFNGADFSVIGLFSNCDKSFVGLFGSNAGTIKNLKVSDVDISIIRDSGHIGSVVGYNNGVIQSCVASGEVFGQSNQLSSEIRIGGIAGTNYGSIAHCSNQSNASAVGNKSSTKVCAGGIAGYNHNQEIIFCHNFGKITSSGVTRYAYAGGIAGSNYCGNITHCDNEGDVSASGSYSSAGGITSKNYGRIVACSNTGTVSAKGSSSDKQDFTGGIASDNYGTLSCCYNCGDVFGVFAGGIAARNYATHLIENCYNVAGVSASRGDYAYLGGIAGTNEGTINANYNIGNIATSFCAAGIVGENDTDGEVKNCYFLETCSSKGIGSGSGTTTPCAEPNLTQQNTFIGFDFEEIWELISWNTYKYPTLKNAKHILVDENAEFVGGNGTAEAPYLIATAKQLNNIRNHLDAHFTLVRNIEFSKSDFTEGGYFYNGGQGWVPIGDKSNWFFYTTNDGFTGVFDGAGYSISGLQITVDANAIVYVGLFAMNNGIIRNLTLRNSTITAISTMHAYAAGITGTNYSGQIENAGVADCTISSSSTGASATAAGIAAFARTESDIVSCYNSGDIYSCATGWAFAGSIVGAGSGVVRNCYNAGKVSAHYNSQSISASSNAGGIVGEAQNTTIQNCYNVGLIKATTLSNSSYSGGLVGRAFGTPTLVYCYYLDEQETAVSGTPDVDTVKGLSLAEMQTPSVYAGFSFDATWTITGNTCYPYPELQNIPMLSHHLYENACDSICYCGYLREVPDHIYDHACDKSCNECGAVREAEPHVSDKVACQEGHCIHCRMDMPATQSHNYDNACDAECNVCGFVRDVPDHVFDHVCDVDCNECGVTRTVPGHVYDNACDSTCDKCGTMRSVSGHQYDNDCDTDCNKCLTKRNVTHSYYTELSSDAVGHWSECKICGHTIDYATHTFSNACDESCNACPFLRQVGDHVWVEGVCAECGEKSPTKAKIITQPKTTYAKLNATAKVSVKATGEGLTYTWYIKNAGKTKYSKSSVKSATYSTKMSSSSKNRAVYCVVKDKYGNEVKSSTVYLRQSVSVTTQPETTYAKKNATAKVTVKASGDGLKYTWYFKNVGKTKYSKSSVTSATYSAKLTSTSKNRIVYCVVKDKWGKTVTTSKVYLREAVSITTQPKTVTVKKNATAKVTVKASGDGLKYTWYIKNAGSSKYSKSSVTKSTYSAKMTSKVKNRLVYCVVTDKYGKTVKSTTVKLKMK